MNILICTIISFNDFIQLLSRPLCAYRVKLITGPNFTILLAIFFTNVGLNQKSIAKKFNIGLHKRMCHRYRSTKFELDRSWSVQAKPRLCPCNALYQRLSSTSKARISAMWAEPEPKNAFLVFGGYLRLICAARTFHGVFATPWETCSGKPRKSRNIPMRCPRRVVWHLFFSTRGKQ